MCTFTCARFRVNAEYSFGARPDAESGETEDVEELSRWMAGVAVDRTFPLRSMLLTAEVFAREPLVEAATDADEEREWNAGAGIRDQLDPRWALDGRVGRRLTGDDKAWYVTFGGAHAFGLPWSR